MEILNEYNLNSIICSGTRSEDMLLRCKYALDSENFDAVKIDEMKDINNLLENIRKSEENNYYILLTYTAMLELRKIITGNSLNV